MCVYIWYISIITFVFQEETKLYFLVLVNCICSQLFMWCRLTLDWQTVSGKLYTRILSILSSRLFHIVTIGTISSFPYQQYWYHSLSSLFPYWYYSLVVSTSTVLVLFRGKVMSYKTNKGICQERLEESSFNCLRGIVYSSSWNKTLSDPYKVVFHCVCDPYMVVF